MLLSIYSMLRLQFYPLYPMSSDEGFQKRVYSHGSISGLSGLVQPRTKEKEGTKEKNSPLRLIKICLQCPTSICVTRYVSSVHLWSNVSVNPQNLSNEIFVFCILHKHVMRVPQFHFTGTPEKLCPTRPVSLTDECQGIELHLYDFKN